LYFIAVNADMYMVLGLRAFFYKCFLNYVQVLFEITEYRK